MRDKSKVQFKEWVSRILQNLILYLKALSPASFDDPFIQSELPREVIFDFIFQKKDPEDEEDMGVNNPNRFIVKEIKDLKSGNMALFI